jgi:hypothetical protein
MGQSMTFATEDDGVLGRLRTDVERLARPEGRRVGSPGHAAAAAFLVERLAAVGVEPYAGEAFALPYAGSEGTFANLVGVAPGRDRALPPVLIGAHYDTAGDLPGADDNAAAVAIALETARRFVARPAERDAVIALFDAEEPPYFQMQLMGSTRFVEDQAVGPVHAALIMDLVGHEVPVPGLEDVVFVTGMETDPALERVLLGQPGRTGLRFATVLNRYAGDRSDHHAFRLHRVPYLFLSCGTWPHYHAPSDTPEKLAYPKMAATVDLLEGLVRDVAGQSLDGPWEGYDTTATDVATLRAAAGAWLETHGVPLRSREDIDRIARLLLRQLGT